MAVGDIRLTTNRYVRPGAYIGRIHRALDPDRPHTQGQARDSGLRQTRRDCTGSLGSGAEVFALS